MIITDHIQALIEGQDVDGTVDALLESDSSPKDPSEGRRKAEDPDDELNPGLDKFKMKKSKEYVRRGKAKGREAADKAGKWLEKHRPGKPKLMSPAVESLAVDSILDGGDIEEALMSLVEMPMQQAPKKKGIIRKALPWAVTAGGLGYAAVKPEHAIAGINKLHGAAKSVATKIADVNLNRKLKKAGFTKDWTPTKG